MQVCKAYYSSSIMYTGVKGERAFLANIVVKVDVGWSLCENYAKTYIHYGSLGVSAAAESFFSTNFAALGGNILKAITTGVLAVPAVVRQRGEMCVPFHMFHIRRARAQR